MHNNIMILHYQPSIPFKITQVNSMIISILD